MLTSASLTTLVLQRNAPNRGIDKPAATTFKQMTSPHGYQPAKTRMLHVQDTATHTYQQQLLVQSTPFKATRTEARIRSYEEHALQDESHAT